jgi:hypothetical protein
MAFNAFTNVLIDEVTKEVLVKGESSPNLEANPRFVVAVAALDDPNTKRTQGDQTEDATASVWTTRLPQPADAEPFEPGDEVFVSGIATSDDSEPFVWGDTKTIDLKPV